MRKSIREKLQDAKKSKEPQLKLQSFDELLALVLGGPPLPTQYRFITDDARLRAYKGPAGCAKTSTLMAAGLMRSLYTPGSKGYVSRHDYNDIFSTIGERFFTMIDRLPKGMILQRDKSPPMTVWLRPIPQWDEEKQEWDETPSKITFMGLKDAVVGVEASWWLVDEANEVDEARIHEIDLRMRNSGGEYMVGLAFNPPDKHHWLYTACTGRDHQDRKIAEPWLKLYEPQPRENQVNLDDDYYDRFTHLREDERQRYVDGEWGATFDGQPVFKEFKYAVHVRDGLKPHPDRPLFRFWDFGYYRPYCVWAQLDWQGRLLHFHEYLGSNMEATAFARACKAITAERFPYATSVLDFGDPAVVQKKDTGSTLGVLAREGITMRYRTAPIERGLNIMRRTMNTMIEGEPAAQWDRRGCPILIQALRGGYALDDKGEKPVKDGFYDHPVDADRYGFLNVLGGMHTGYLTGDSAGGGSSHGNHNLPTSVAYDPAYDQR